jgi:hypothetical protein
MVRRLPVLQGASVEEPSLERPAWRWVGLGAALALVLWGALAAILLPISARLGASLTGATLTLGDLTTKRSAGEQAAIVMFAAGPVLLGFVLAVGASAALISRYAAPAGARRGVAVGLATAAGAWAIGAALEAFSFAGAAIFALAVLGTVGALAGWFGGRVGQAWPWRERSSGGA